MKVLATTLIGLALTLQLVGCGAKDEQPEGVLTNAQEQALDKAKNMEQDLIDAAQKKLGDIDSK